MRRSSSNPTPANPPLRAGSASERCLGNASVAGYAIRAGSASERCADNAPVSRNSPSPTNVLPVPNISARRVHVLTLPEVSRTGAFRPDHRPRRDVPACAKRPRPARFELPHHHVGFDARVRDNDVNVVAANSAVVEFPLTDPAMPTEHVSNDLARGGSQFDRRMRHSSSFELAPRAARVESRRFVAVVPPIHRAARIAMQPSAVGVPGQQIAERFGHQRQYSNTGGRDRSSGCRSVSEAALACASRSDGVAGDRDVAEAALACASRSEGGAARSLNSLRRSRG